MNTQTHIPRVRLKKAKQNRYNPIPAIANLTDPTQLARKLDASEAGNLKDAVNIWDSLEQLDDPSETLSETSSETSSNSLNEYVDKWVIRSLYGEDVKPLANVKVLITPEQCTTADIQIDEFLYLLPLPFGKRERVGERDFNCIVTAPDGALNPSPSEPSAVENSSFPNIKNLRKYLI